MSPNIVININLCGCPGRRCPPEAATWRYFVVFLEGNMATVQANWTPSVNLDTTPPVTSQTVTFSINGVAMPALVFNDNTTATASVPANAGDTVTCDHFCTNSAGDSLHISATVTVATPANVPNPATNLTLTVLP